MGHTIKTIVYITRDIERAIGLIPSETYRIVTNSSVYAEAVAKQYPKFVTIISSPITGPLDTADLIHTITQNPALAALNTLLRSPETGILVFKNTSQIETLTKENGWNLLNPSAELAETVENKISQIEWLGDGAKKYLPEHIVAPTRELTWQDKPFIVQWAHSHTGDGTILIRSKAELETIQASFPERLARAAEFIYGPSFTVNVVVAVDAILVGNISYQITGQAPFTDSIFSTIGNDWGLTHSLLEEIHVKEIETMARDLGTQLRTDGWKGLFGIDVLYDETRNRIFLIEINARQPASTTFESILQMNTRDQGVAGLTTFEAHCAAMIGQTLPAGLVFINDGAQIIQRITRKITEAPEAALSALSAQGYSVIVYPNTAYNSDLVRIQSNRGIMETHNKFNARGKEVLDSLSK